MELLNHQEVVDLISAVGSDVFVLVQGENGVGKTSLHRDLCKLPQFKNHIKMDPLECTQLSDGSVWMPALDMEQGISRELPNERFGLSRTNQRGVNGSKPLLFCLDEVLKVPQYIKNVLSSIIYERRLGSFHFVEGTVGFGCTNLSTEGLGDTLQAHFRSRLMMVTMRKPTASEWTLWAAENGLEAEIIAFVHMHPRMMASFMDYEPGGKYHGKQQEKDNQYIFNPHVVQDGFVSPRTLHIASKIVAQQKKLTPNTLTAALAGTVGVAGAKELAAYIRFGQDIPLFEKVVADPKGTKLPDNPTAQIVQAFQFITRVENRTDATAVVTYVKRMRNEIQSLFCNAVANSQGSVVKFATAPGFGELMSSNKCYFSSR